LPVSSAWYNGDWLYRTKITIPNSSLNGDLIDFPVYLDLSEFPSNFFTQVQADGDDIRVTNGNGLSERAFELVDIDIVNGAGELWFKTNLSSTVDQDFFVYYGNPAATGYLESDTYGKHNVWTDGYIAVYHMNNNPTGTIYDSTSNSNDGTSAGSMTSSDLVDSRLGKGIDFDGVDDALDFGTSIAPSGDLSVSVWSNPDSTQVSWAAYLGRSNGSSWDQGFGLYEYSGTNETSFFVQHWNTNLAKNLSVRNQWSYNYGEWDQANLNLYINDEFKATDAYAGSITMPADHFYIGKVSDTSLYHINAVIDEVRLSSKVRSRDWQMAEYRNQSSDEIFYIVNGFHLDSSWPYSAKVTIPASMVNGDLEEIPLHVDLSELGSHFFSNVDPNGDDIRVSLADMTTETAFELVAIDTVNGSGELWFKAPFMSATVDNDFYIWYGKSGAISYNEDDIYGTHNVWSNGFVAVYHMNEAPTGVLRDSTRFSNDGVSSGSMTLSDLVVGQLGYSIAFDGSDDRINIGNDPTLNPAQMSVMLWANNDSSIPDNCFGILFAKWGPNAYHLNHQNACSGNAPQAYIDTTVSPGQVQVNHATNLNEDEWNQVGFTFNGNQLEIFVEGQFSNSTAITGDIETRANDTFIGAKQAVSSGFEFDGGIDEIHVSDRVRSRDWIETSFHNQNGTTGFVLIEEEKDDQAFFMMLGN
jgi:hypothetical protein